MTQLKLPQCLLGSEAQLTGFVAALPRRLASRCVFAPLPEVFADARGLQAAWPGGLAAPPAAEMVHLRFGSVRTARLLKGARNAAVVAEHMSEQPLASSGHPFADGRHLPAAVQRVFAYAPFEHAPVRVDGAALPVSLLPAACLAADLPASARKTAKTGVAGLDIVGFADFSSGAWAAGAVPASSQPDVPRDGAAPLVLLPWNLDHPGSIVPELLTRLARLQDPAAPRVRILLLPFNYLGQTGIIRRLIRQVAEAGGTAALAQFAIGRLTSLAALPRLRALSLDAWVEAGDPEHHWTMARLAAARFRPRALVHGEERIWVEIDTRYGRLAFHTAIPSHRELHSLLDDVGAAAAAL